eukprot:gene5050-5545_t
MPLRYFFRQLARKEGILLLLGDSVMQQFYSALACELEREQVWNDPNYFMNTDELRIVSFPKLNTTAAIRFIPMYHLVNGRYDRIPNATMTNLQKHMKEDILLNYKTIVIVANMGLHYVDNPVVGFTQHFPTSNGYWPGVRYAQGMKIGCIPIQDLSPQADWRNRIIEDIIRNDKLYKIEIIPFYNLTASLWSEHPNGHLRDCTHFCWSPFLYQPIFHALAKKLKLTSSKIQQQD